MSTASTSNAIGAFAATGNFNGSIDDVMIFNKSLTQEEITAIYTNSSARFKASGTTTLKQQTLTSTAGVVNLTINSTEKLLGSNVTGRVGFWDKSSEYQTYNETGYAGFDGSNDYVSVANSSGLNNITDALTISAWVKYNNITGYDGIILQKTGYTTTAGGYGLFAYSNNKLYFIYGNGTGYPANLVSTNALADLNVWQHFIVTLSVNSTGTGNVSFYKNGVLNSSHITNYGNLKADTYPLKIGLYDIGVTKYLNGSLDDVMIFNRTLNSTEITSIYNLNRSKYNGSTSGLVSYYSFNSLSARDDFGNNSGTSTNGVSYSPKNTASNFNLSGLVGFGTGYLIRLGLLKRKLRVLGEEEVLLLQLMKVVQRDCFENNKMSMEEYNEAMIQYESRLGKVIQDKIKTETQIANINKLSGKKSALKQEKERLIILVKQTQDDYMNKGKLDTRIYENMLRTYATRLNKIQEELAYMEAEYELRKVTSFWGKFFGK